MTIFEYNFRTILVHSTIILGILWIFHDFYKASKSDGIRIFCFVVCILLILIMICSMFLFIAYKDTVITEGKITDITCTGSLAGLLDHYTIYISKENGDVVNYSTSLISSMRFKKAITELSVGDQIRIHFNSFLDVMYRFEKIDTEGNSLS